MLILVEDRWLIHVKPNVEQLVSSFKLVVAVKTLPVLSAFGAVGVNPDALSRPALTLEGFEVVATDPKPLIFFLFKFLTFMVDKVLAHRSDMRVCDYHESSACIAHCFLHIVQVGLLEQVVVKSEGGLLPVVLNVKPKYIQREPVGVELVTSRGDAISVNLCPFRVMEAKALKRRQWCMSCDCGDVFQQLLWLSEARC